MFCFFACALYGQVDSISTVQHSNKESTSVRFLSNYYTQDGIHSSVTGGKGSEDLNVMVQDIVVHLVPDSIKWYDLELGIDVISSASTDSIDFNVSSASRKDGRVHMRFGYGRNFKNNWSASMHASGSVESDYFSKGLRFSMNKALNPMQSFAIHGQLYLDDVRWGWYQEGRGIKLIYPEELRDMEWFDEYKRNTYALSASWNQVVNKHLQFSVISDIVYQEGLLSTPFHRVYFTDQERPHVELLPRERLKFPIAIQLNYQTPIDLIVRSYYRFYTDDFGIIAHTAKIELPYHVHVNWSIHPFYRFYSQSASTYFQPYRMHSINNTYYTSDYDFSKFTSHEYGLGLSYRLINLNKTIGPNALSLNKIALQYGHYSRSDALSADFISLLFNFAKP